MLYVSIINIHDFCVKVKYIIILFIYKTHEVFINPLDIVIYKNPLIRSRIWEPETEMKEILERSSFKLCIDSLSWTPLLLFIPIFLLMELCTAVLPVLLNGKLSMELGVNVIVPDRLIKLIANWQRKDLNL